MNEALSRESVPRIARGFRFQWEEAQQCHVLLYPEGMVKLSQSAGEILKRCDGQRTIAQIVEDLKRQFPGADLEGDVHTFLGVANERGWIHTQ